MTTTCLINNYNYGRFVGEALESVLRQTVPFDEIIVVDDGSTDGSAELLANRYGNQRAVQIVQKENEGQLSCFNEGFARASGDIVFFLDADDVYEPHYLEQALAVYDRDSWIDFVICGHRQFGQRESLQLDHAHDSDLGYSVLLTAWLREWIGGPTSCLSSRRTVLEKILPLPFHDSWRTRADDCLVFGSSLAGARKYYLAQPLVRYRTHNQNQFFGRRADKFAVYRRRLAVNALFAHLERKLCYDIRRLAENHHREFCTIGRPTFGQLVKYYRIGLGSPGALVRRLARMAEMTAYYLRALRQPLEAATEADSHMVPLPRVFDPARASDDRQAPPDGAQRRAA